MQMLTFHGSTKGAPKHEHCIIATLLNDLIAHCLDVLVLAHLGIVINQRLDVGRHGAVSAAERRQRFAFQV